MLFALWMPLVISLVAWCSFERLLKPRPGSLFSRPGYANAIDIGTWAVLYAGFTLLLERSWFAMVVLGSLHMVIIQVSNTKANTLREPFLCQDFEYFVDMIKHPRLYLPFFGIGLAIASSLAGLMAIIAGFWLEPSIFFAHGWQALTPVLGVLCLGVVSLWTGLKCCRPTAEELAGTPLDPNDELARYGMTTLLWRQGRELRTPLASDIGRDEFRSETSLPHVEQNNLPHVVIVQSESFFDPRRWYPGIRSEVLAPWDRVADQAEQRGQLHVPVWGANTVRSECAFLTGLSGGTLGGHRFNPYHALSKRDVPSLIQQFKRLGYRTLCIHPYPENFYLRNKVFPRFGFDEFIDEKHFNETQRDGQYTSDLALSDKVATLLETAQQPLMIMLITMENHGPLHLERQPDHPEQWYRKMPDSGCEDLTVYLRHLHNGGLMVEHIAETLIACSRKKQPREGMLCFYGDHVPIMADTYKALGYPDGMTEYFLWSTSGNTHTTPQTRSLEDLGPQLLNAVLAKAGNHTQGMK